MTDSDSRSRLPLAERKEKTLKRVAEEFAENGFAGTRMTDLADAAEISEAMLVKLFDTKKNLYRALIEHKADQNPGTAFPDNSDSMSPDEVLRTLARNIVNRCNEDTTFFRLLYYSGLEDNELADMFFEARVDELRSRLTGYLQKQMDENKLRDRDPETVATGFIGMITHLLTLEHIFGYPTPGDREQEEIVDQFVDIVMNGLKA